MIIVSDPSAITALMQIGREGVPFIGLVGVLIEARQRGLIVSLRTILEQLQTSADFRLSEQLKRQALKAAGEKTD
ncbi:MAG TPA: DUF3368 domain-containing protein [Verrucomicrobiae bacterium]|jgi:hypothetical protein